MALLAHLVGNCWMIEQPSSSLFFLNCRFQWLLRRYLLWQIPESKLNSVAWGSDFKFCVLSFSLSLSLSPYWLCFRVSSSKTYKQALWLRKFGHKIPKRTLLYANSPIIRRFETGKLAKRQRGNSRKHSGVRSYVDRKGRKRCVGSAKLKATQCLGRARMPLVTCLNWMFVNTNHAAQAIPREVCQGGGEPASALPPRAWVRDANGGAMTSWRLLAGF